MSVINTAWVDNVVTEIDAVPDCATLAVVVAQLEVSLQKQLDAATAQIAALLPLTTVPTNLAQVLAFATAQQAFYLAMYNQAIATEAALVIASARISGALASKISSLHCTLTLSAPL